VCTGATKWTGCNSKRRLFFYPSTWRALQIVGDTFFASSGRRALIDAQAAR